MKMNPDEINPLVRIAEALESIAKNVEKMANPVISLGAISINSHEETNKSHDVIF